MLISKLRLTGLSLDTSKEICSEYDYVGIEQFLENAELLRAIRSFRLPIKL